MPEILLGIDIGTTATKVVLIDHVGHILADASKPTALNSPELGWAEEDPNQWWENVCLLIPEVLQRAGLNASQVAAVGASGMVPALVLLNERGEVLRPSIQQNDARAVVEINFERSQTDEADILARTGSPITQQSIGPKLLWLVTHEPETMKRTRHVMGSYDYINYRLTGQFSIERNWALESGLFDFRAERWDSVLVRLAGIDQNLLGRVRWSAEIAGAVTPKAAAQTGLLVGTPVVAGSADHIASAFSAGLKSQGDLLVKLGGSGDILYCLDRARMDPRLYLDYHVIPGKFILNGCMAASGSLIRWFRDQFAPGVDFPALDQESAGIPAGADGLVLLPYFLGEKTPINDPLARGTVVGLTLSHSRAHLYRAILEGIAYGFKHHLQVLAGLGYPATRARLTNGGAHSRLWRKITADVLGLRLEEIDRHPGSSLGAAFIAGKGTGIFSAWEQIEDYIQIASVTDPDPENYARYETLFGVYLETYIRLKDLYPVLVNRANS